MSVIYMLRLISEHQPGLENTASCLDASSDEDKECMLVFNQKA
jgi:hypothetical protein